MSQDFPRANIEVTAEIEGGSVTVDKAKIWDGTTIGEVDATTKAQKTLDMNAVVGFDNSVGPDGKFDWKKPIVEGNDKGYEDTSFVTGESPRVLDVNTDLGRNAREGGILNDGAGDLLVEISNDGATYGDQHTLKADEVFDLEGRNVDSIRLTWVADTGYRAVVV